MSKKDDPHTNGDATPPAPNGVALSNSVDPSAPPALPPPSPSQPAADLPDAHPHHNAHDPISASDPQRSLLPDSHHRLSTQSVTSLTSSRPAPPSPAVSRRASCRSHTSSRPVSGMSSAVSSRPVSGIQHPLSRPTSGALQPTTPTTMNTPTPTTTTTFSRLSHDRHSLAPMPDPDLSVADPTPTPTQATPPELIQIRDYGFAPSDPRFTGQGPHVPRANRPVFLARRLASGPSSSSSTDDEDEWEDDDDDSRMANVWEDVPEDANGWRGFKWGFGPAWVARPSSIAAGPGSFPSRGDLDRNFGGEDEDEDMEEDELGEGYEEGEPPLYPGLYRGLYAFEPEGTAEMRLDEDQLVRVIGRGGGVGWAVVVKDGLKDTGVHALVPESYLEVVRLDGEEDEDV